MNLKKLMGVCLIGFLIFGSSLSLAKESPEKKSTIFTPDAIKWVKAPEALPNGAEVAVLEGDPSKKDFFTMRLKLPANYRIAPHTHPGHERVTVISGTLYFGHGKDGDSNKTIALPAGSYFSMEPKAAHYVFAREPVILQLNSTGPWKIDYFKSEDDPRKKKA